ncbi:MAG: ribose 5-phosphate isomerase B [Candidatus Kapabacteria bacterium]|nr:ribose 5-phosphate isomerase B [Candidatus Kapabacteria bacterium]
MKIAFGSDHAGFKYKKLLIEFLRNQHSQQILDFGCFSEESVDYPDYALPVSECVASGVADIGILVCGTGIGMAILANKVMGIRAANCCSADAAKLSKEHNNANILTIGARLVSIEEAKEIAEAFLYGEFLGNRHMIRVEKIHELTGW